MVIVRGPNSIWSESSHPPSYISNHHWFPSTSYARPCSITVLLSTNWPGYKELYRQTTMRIVMLPIMFIIAALHRICFVYISFSIGALSWSLIQSKALVLHLNWFRKHKYFHFQRYLTLIFILIHNSADSKLIVFTLEEIVKLCFFRIREMLPFGKTPFSLDLKWPVE